MAESLQKHLRGGAEAGMLRARWPAGAGKAEAMLAAVDRAVTVACMGCKQII